MRRAVTQEQPGKRIAVSP